MYVHYAPFRLVPNRNSFVVTELLHYPLLPVLGLHSKPQFRYSRLLVTGLRRTTKGGEPNTKRLSAFFVQTRRPLKKIFSFFTIYSYVNKIN